MRNSKAAVILCSSLSAACQPPSIDPTENTDTSSSGSEGDGDGDGTDTRNGSGDGDGDTGPGDGDGDTGSGDGDGDGDTGSGDGDGDDDTDSGDGDGDGPEPLACPEAVEQVELTTYGLMFIEGEPDVEISAELCNLPEQTSMRLEDWALEEQSFLMTTEGCAEPELQLYMEHDMPNNNWWVGWSIDETFFPGVCYDVFMYSEVTGPDTCKLSRFDLVDPAQPEVLIYSIGTTAEHLDHNGLRVEPIDPVACESVCNEGEVRDLQFTVADESAVIEADGFPWLTLETEQADVEIIYFDSFAQTLLDGEGCEGGPALEVNAWAARRTGP